MSTEENKSINNGDLKLNFIKTESNAQCRDQVKVGETETVMRTTCEGSASTLRKIIFQF